MKGTVTNSQKQICQITFEPRTREHRSLIQRLIHLNILNLNASHQSAEIAIHRKMAVYGE